MSWSKLRGNDPRKLVTRFGVISSVRRILKRGRGGRNFRKFEKNKDQNKKCFTQTQSDFPVQNWVKTKKQNKRSSLKFSPIFWPKLGAGQKQRSSPTFCVLKASAQRTKRGPCRNFAYYSMLIILSWRPKGRGMA